jgi:hypothetical protein
MKGIRNIATRATIPTHGVWLMEVAGIIRLALPRLAGRLVPEVFHGSPSVGMMVSIIAVWDKPGLHASCIW